MADDNFGYGKPPKHSQFQPGKSGNPKGRPPEPRDSDLASILWRALRKRVSVTENGVRRKREKLEVLTTQLANKAISMDLRAIHLLLTLIRCLPEPSQAPAPDYEKLTTEELEVMINGDLEKIFQKVKWPRRKN
jgi:hypothetical protein